jgi:Ser/Thr protein kinase RdoA (MazF antagonist)
VSVGFNFLEAPELSAPQVSEAQAEEILASHFGLRVRATSLGSQQGKNFVVTAPDDRQSGVQRNRNRGAGSGG